MRWHAWLVVVALGHPAWGDELDVAPCPASVVATTLGGVVRDRTTEELLAGATVILTIGDHTEAAITDETGTFSFPVEPATYDLTVYFADSTWEQRKIEVARGQQIVVVAKLDSTERVTGCYFGPPPVTTEAMPHYGRDITRDWAPIARDRTDRAWIAPIEGADPERAVTTVGGAHRLAGGLGVPLLFVENVETRTLRAEAHQAMGTGGAAEVSLVSGSNESHAAARGSIDVDGSGRGEAIAGGSIVHDHAWWIGGLVAHANRDGRLDGDALLRLDLAVTPEHQLAVAAIGQTHTDGTRDDWADAAWTSKLDDYRLELHAGATAERLVLPALTFARSIGATGEIDRVAGRTSVIYRARAAGYHHLEAGTELGTGTVGLVRHADAVAYAGDQWDVKPNVTLEAAVRGELRRFGGAQTRVTAPRAAIEWDPTEEGRGGISIAYERVPHLDDGPLGAWRGQPRYHDELALGAHYEPAHHDWIVVGAATRMRWLAGAERTGFDGWARIRGERLSLQAGATSLDRVATVMARRRFGSYDETFDATVNARVGLHRELGAGLAWRHRGHGSTVFDTAVEAFTGDLGPAARLVLGARF